MLQHVQYFVTLLFASAVQGSFVRAPRSLLIVEDDRALRSTLAEQLSTDGEFVVSEGSSAAEAEAHLFGAKVSYEIMLLDVGLLDVDGCDSAASCGATDIACRSSC